MTLQVCYNDISLISALLAVPNHAFAAPQFERDIGASQSDVDEFRVRLLSHLEARSDYPEYHQLALRTDTREQTRTFKMSLPVSLNDVVLLSKGFREAVKFTRENDDFRTMTGFSVEDAEGLERDIDEIFKNVVNQG